MYVVVVASRLLLDRNSPGDSERVETFALKITLKKTERSKQASLTNCL